MQRIHAIIGILTKSEKKFLKSFLETFHGKQENKILDLVKLVEKKPTITHSEAARKLYGDPKSKAFIMTKARLLDRLNDVILMGSSINNNEAVEQDPLVYDVMDSQKLLIIAMGLRKRGLSWYSRQLLLDELKKEHVQIRSSLKLQMLELLRMHLDTGLEVLKELDTINEEIELTKQKADLETFGASIMHKYSVMTSLQHYSKINTEEFLSKSIKEYEERKNCLHSPLGEYYYLSMLIHLCSVRQDIPKEKNYLSQLIELLSQNSKIVDNNTKAFQLHRLSLIEIEISNYENAINLLDSVVEFIKTRPENHIAILLAKSYSLFYLGDTSGIDECVEFCKSLSNQEHLNVLLVRYQQLTKFYITRDFKSFFRFLVEVETLFQNKHHWNAALRVFEIMVLIETGESDAATIKIENLRKFIANNTVYPRYEYIYKILRQLEQSAYNFAPNPKMDSLIQELNEKSKWDPIYLEMVKVDTWYRALQSKTDYFTQFKNERKIIDED